MKNLVGKRNKGTSGLTSKVLMLVLILVAFATYTLFARVAPNLNNKASIPIVRLSSPISLFNPFTLETSKIKDVSVLKTEGISFFKIDNALVTRSTTKITQIQIPFKPEVRSVFKPDLF